MQINSWRQVSALVEGWGDQALSKFTQAESHVALNPDDASGPVAMYRNVGHFPGPLQTRNYVEALCRGIGLTAEWTRRNIILRMARQHLLQVSGVRQQFLVDEAALTYRPGGFKEVVAPQLDYVLRILRYDFTGGNRLDFRVVPTARAAALPSGVYADTFSLFKVGDSVEGFTEPWGYNRVEEVDDTQRTLLEHSWEQIGAMALNRADSIDLVQQKLREL